MKKVLDFFKKLPIPFVGFGLYFVSFVLLLVAYIIAILAFTGFNLPVDRFVLIFPIFGMVIILAQLVVSMLDENKPLWFDGINVLFCFLVLFSFARLLIPFLTPIGIYFTVNMGDVETYAIVVPRCITGCILFAVSCLFFIAANFFKVTYKKEAK